MKKQLIYGFIALIGIPLCTACNNDDDDETSETPVDTETSKENVDGEHFFEVASNLFNSEEYELDVDSTIYTPAYGKVLDQAEPTVYSLGRDSAEDARLWFLDHCVPSDLKDSCLQLTENIKVDFGTYGSITYIPSSTSDVLATIYIDIPLVPEQTQLKMIPMSLWPENESSIISAGNIVYDKYGENGIKSYYICVAACVGGNKGELITFDTQWNEQRWISDKFKSVTVFANRATLDAWRALASVYKDKVTSFKNWRDKIAKVAGVPDYLYNSPAIQALYHRNSSSEKSSYNLDCLYACGNGWDDGGHWYYYWLWWYGIKKVEQDFIDPSSAIEIRDGLPSFAKSTFTYANDRWTKTTSSYRSHSTKFTNEDGDRFEKIYDSGFK